jgi:hypothetical protein
MASKSALPTPTMMIDKGKLEADTMACRENMIYQSKIEFKMTAGFICLQRRKLTWQDILHFYRICNDLIFKIGWCNCFHWDFSIKLGEEQIQGK